MRSWFRPDEDFRWAVAWGFASIASGMVPAINDLADNHDVAPIFHAMRPAFDRGLSLVLPLAVALVWVGRVVWRRLHI
jgi:hypothetical protein